MRTIEPLLLELAERQPNAGVGVRPRGPVTFQLAEQMSLISDGLFLEATAAHAAARGGRLAQADRDMPSAGPTKQALAIAQWLHDSGGNKGKAASFPGLAWLRQPDGYSDREWILEIARQYRTLDGSPALPVRSGSSAPDARNGNGHRSRPAVDTRESEPLSEQAALRKVAD
jgi:hypothetical protein